MKVEFICKNGVELPKPSTELAGAVDLQARGILKWYTAQNIPLTPEQLRDVNWDFKAKKPIRLLRGQRILIDTDLVLANCPSDFRGDVKSRSGLALKEGVFVLNGDGLVDADYRQGIGVILTNTSKEAFEIRFNDRIAQFEVRRGFQVEYSEATEITSAESSRNGGFGHTGK